MCGHRAVLSFINLLASWHTPSLVDQEPHIYLFKNISSLNSERERGYSALYAVLLIDCHVRKSIRRINEL